MKLKQYVASILDGIFQGFCETKVLLGLAFSQILSKMPLETCLVIGCLIAMFTAIIYLILIHKERSNKNLIKLSLISFLAFVVSSPILFALPFSIFPQREIGDAEGIGIILVLASYLIIAVVVRLGILVGVLVRNNRKS